jgi:hypothetical protein
MRVAARMMLLLGSIAAAGVAPLPASAQGSQIAAAANAARANNPIRVQVGINFFVPGPTDDSKEAVANRDTARRQIYDMAGKECELLRATIAADCTLESISVNINRQFGRQQPEGFSVNGSLSIQVTQK